MRELNDFLISLPTNYNQMGFFLFMVLFFIVFFLLPSKKYVKETWILFGNIFFYLRSGTASLVIILGTVLIVYISSMLMGKIYGKFEVEKINSTPRQQIELLAEYKKSTRIILYVSGFVIVGIWVFVKICRLNNLENAYTFSSFRFFETVIVPIGISFYTLSALGYLMDVYYRKIKPEHNILYLMMAMTYFPIIVQGPISKYTKLIDQFKHLPKFDYERVTYGIQLFIWGLFKKLVIADRLLIFANTVFGAAENYYGVEIIFALILSLIQMYADFSACMDMVQGVANMMGVELEKNFNQPFFSTRCAEYWRRWHITLGAWFRDYVYLPIYMHPVYMRAANKIKKNFGKDRGQLFVTATISIIIWILTGLWHGTGWNYIVWGLYWYLLIVSGEGTEKFWKHIADKLGIDCSSGYFHVWQMTRTFICALIGRLWTVAGNLKNCGLIWKHIVTELHIWFFFDGSIYRCGLSRPDFWLAILAIGVLWGVDYAHEKNVKIRDYIAHKPIVIRWTIYYMAIFSIIIFGIYGSGYDASSFVYGGF